MARVKQNFSFSLCLSEQCCSWSTGSHSDSDTSKRGLEEEFTRNKMGSAKYTLLKGTSGIQSFSMSQPSAKENNVIDDSFYIYMSAYEQKISGT